MTPDEIARAIKSFVAEDESIDILQLFAVGPDLPVEVKVHLADSDSWLEKFVPRQDWETPAVYEGPLDDVVKAFQEGGIFG